MALALQYKNDSSSLGLLAESYFLSDRLARRYGNN